MGGERCWSRVEAWLQNEQIPGSVWFSVSPGEVVQKLSHGTCSFYSYPNTWPSYIYRLYTIMQPAKMPLLHPKCFVRCEKTYYLLYIFITSMYYVGCSLLCTDQRLSTKKNKLISSTVQQGLSHLIKHILYFHTMINYLWKKIVIKLKQQLQLQLKQNSCTSFGSLHYYLK